MNRNIVDVSQYEVVTYDLNSFYTDLYDYCLDTVKNDYRFKEMEDLAKHKNLSILYHISQSTIQNSLDTQCTRVSVGFDVNNDKNETLGQFLIVFDFYFQCGKSKVYIRDGFDHDIVIQSRNMNKIMSYIYTAVCVHIENSVVPFITNYLSTN